MLKGKNAIITGAGSGIGYATVEKFAQNGANIWAFVHISKPEVIEKYKEIADKNGVWIKLYEFELMDDNVVKQAVKQVIADGQNIDVLVNCAGIVNAKTLGMTSINELRQIMEANFFTPSLLMQLVSRKMMRQRFGNIVNIISRAAPEFRAGAYAYGSSKMALLWGTKAVAKELSPYNIRVNGVAPGLTQTKLGTGRMSEEEIAMYVSNNNIKRPATPEEVAATVLYLASDMSSYVSGQILNCDGGRY
ncbi:MAG: SDR family oxidoreductase [Bacteroides thetaiotaomicron]|nr:SDR family oxidoreductase [Bacteroides thetaiotaomicron]